MPKRHPSRNENLLAFGHVGDIWDIYDVHIYIGGWGAETNREIVSVRSCVRAQLYTRAEWSENMFLDLFPFPFSPQEFFPFPLGALPCSPQDLQPGSFSREQMAEWTKFYDDLRSKQNDWNNPSKRHSNPVSNETAPPLIGPGPAQSMGGGFIVYR